MTLFLTLELSLDNQRRSQPELNPPRLMDQHQNHESSGAEEASRARRADPSCGFDAFVSAAGRSHGPTDTARFWVVLVAVDVCVTVCVTCVCVRGIIPALMCFYLSTIRAVLAVTNHKPELVPRLPSWSVPQLNFTRLPKRRRVQAGARTSAGKVHVVEIKNKKTF